MKNKIKSISIAMLMLALASVVIARANYQMSISNQSQYYTGTTELTQQSGNPVYTTFTGPDNVPVTVTSNPTGFIINGYNIAPGTVGYAYIRYSNFGVQLKVDFTSANIVIQDQQIVQ